MTWIIWGVLILVGACLALVATPVRLRFVAETHPEPRAYAHAALFGGLAPEFTITDSQRRDRKDKTKDKKPEEKPRKRRKSGQSWSGLRLAKALPRLFLDLLHVIKFERLRAEGAFGFDDPADTGHLFGQLTPFIYGAAPAAGLSVSVRPEFGGRCLSGSAEGIVSIVPAALVPPFVRFGWRAFGPTP